jgi:hypothetical protein
MDGSARHSLSKKRSLSSSNRVRQPRIIFAKIEARVYRGATKPLAHHHSVEEALRREIFVADARSADHLENRAH